MQILIHAHIDGGVAASTGRGFDSSLGYLQGSEDHYTQVASYADGCKGIDLYRSTGPAYGYNGTYSSFLYTREVDRVVEAHVPANGPLMMYVALQVMHAPNAVPVQYSDIYPSPQYSSDYAVYNGMGYAADHVASDNSVSPPPISLPAACAPREEDPDGILHPAYSYDGRGRGRGGASCQRRSLSMVMADNGLTMSAPFPCSSATLRLR